LTTLTTGALATEVLETTLLAVEDLTRRLTLLALDAVQHPEHSPDGLSPWVDPNEQKGFPSVTKLLSVVNIPMFHTHKLTPE
jgi:hypothetical protein